MTDFPMLMLMLMLMLIQKYRIIYIALLRRLVLAGALTVATLICACSQSGLVDVELTPTPAVIPRGQSLEIQLYSDTRLDSSVPELSISPMDGFSYHSIEKVGENTVTFQLSVGATAPLGKRLISLVAGKTRGECEITITEALPDSDSGNDSEPLNDSDSNPDSEVSDTSTDSILLQPSVELRPDSIFTGESKTMSLFGSNTHFSASTEIRFPEGSGLVVLSKEYLGVTTDGEQLLFELEASADATVGNVIGTVTGPAGDGVETVYFSIEVITAPTLVVSPATGVQGENVSVSLHGFGTHFQTDAPATLVLIEPASQGVNINLDVIYGPQEMGATVYISDSAVPGEYTVSAATELDGETEVVAAAFTVVEADVVDTDTADTDTGNVSPCNDFEVIPSQLPIGTYDKGIRLEASGNLEWITYDKSVSLVGENENIYLAGLDVAPEPVIDAILLSTILNTPFGEGFCSV